MFSVLCRDESGLGGEVPWFRYSYARAARPHLGYAVSEWFTRVGHGISNTVSPLQHPQGRTSPLGDAPGMCWGVKWALGSNMDAGE